LTKFSKNPLIVVCACVCWTDENRIWVSDFGYFWYAN